MTEKFSKYTIDELIEFHEAIDKINNPHKELELNNEIERRKASGEVPSVDKTKPSLTPEERKEKRLLILLFWCFSGIIFPVFLRLFWVLFAFIYGGIIVLIFGKAVENIVAILAILSSLVFSVGAFVWLYRQFKKHLVDS
jgi:hypothetical protein